MESKIARVESIQYDLLKTDAFVKWVLPTVILQPFHQEAGVTLDALLYKNKNRLSADSCRRLTELLWPSFCDSMRQGRDVDAEEAKTLLVAKSHAFVRAQRDHVVFKHGNNVFVAEYEMNGTVANVFQCWKGPASEIHPATVFVTFKDISEKEDFDRLASELGYSADDLILALARDFAAKLAHRADHESNDETGPA